MLIWRASAAAGRLPSTAAWLSPMAARTGSPERQAGRIGHGGGEAGHDGAARADFGEALGLQARGGEQVFAPAPIDDVEQAERGGVGGIDPRFRSGELSADPIRDGERAPGRRRQLAALAQRVERDASETRGRTAARALERLGRAALEEGLEVGAAAGRRLVGAAVLPGDEGRQGTIIGVGEQDAVHLTGQAERDGFAVEGSGERAERSPGRLREGWRDPARRGPEGARGGAPGWGAGRCRGPVPRRSMATAPSEVVPTSRARASCMGRGQAWPAGDFGASRWA